MSDNYQAVYDAIRSRFHFNSGDLIDRLAQQFDISHAVYMVRDAWQVAANEQERPFVLLKPKLYPDGNQWCALYGDDLQNGLSAFGTTPAEAAAAFDVAWFKQTCGKEPTPQASAERDSA